MIATQNSIPVMQRIPSSPKEHQHDNMSITHTARDLWDNTPTSTCTAVDTLKQKIKQAPARCSVDDGGLVTVEEDRAGHEAELQDYSGGVLAGSAIPAGVCLGQWPEESALLGANLLQKGARRRRQTIESSIGRGQLKVSIV
ncbi:hypothetical protein PoB_004184600 [Plakobranchus ocellatus]|uniref:Uncharacterized protein n=1 Tax=Plakobranchus ocellatus TaxID=259542 RepID=A0AAV4AW76_9GAST|nr:hypothetical protein PoB_004184600 [Plakobranchus ocellatus]